MKKCVNCGTELEDNAKFCGECGTKQPERKKFCANCGRELSANAKFCMECGTPVAYNASTNLPIHPVSTPAINESNSASPNIENNVSVKQTDDETITIVIKGIPINMKLVIGRDHGTENEIPDFYMGETPVTQALWFLETGNNPSVDNADLNYPVTNITSSAATSFLIMLMKETGIKFELPTRVQWEHAYKGGYKSNGFKYSGSNELSEVGWNDSSLHPVGRLFANELGLTDMDGNVNELLKNNDFAPRIADNPSDDIDFTGLRLIINIPKDGNISGNSELREIVTSQLPHLQNLREISVKGYERIAKENEERMLKEYEEQGIVRYVKDKETDFFKIFEKLGGEEYRLHREQEEQLRILGNEALDSSRTKWKTFGEYGKDLSRYGKPDYDYNEDIEYAIINGDTLILKGFGTMPDIPTFGWKINMEGNYWDINQDIKDNQGKITKLAIIGDITYIGDRCFEGFWNLETIILPETIVTIGNEAFRGCNSLKFISLYKGLKEIGEGAFRDTDLKYLFIPSSNKRIKKNAFESSDLSVVFLPDITKVDDEAFDSKLLKR